MNPESMSTSIQCDDHAETLVFERSIWGKDDELLEFSIMDSYIGRREYQGIIGRFRRACHAFFAKPIYYAGVVVTSYHFFERMPCHPQIRRRRPTA